MKRYFIAIFSMSRPTQLLLVSVVYVFGVLIAIGWDHTPDLSSLFWGLAGLIPISASIHTINEYADHETDALTTRTLFSGGSGALKKTGLPRTLALRSAWTEFVIGSVIAMWGYARGDINLTAIIILITGAFFGWMYSVRPLALAWIGWGELDNALLGGVLIPLFGYAVVAGRVDYQAVLGVVPFGMLAFINLLATTWPDRDADAAVGKFTLATRWTVSRLRFLYWTVAVLSFLVLFLLSGWVLPTIVVWASFLVIPFVVWGGWVYTRQHSPFPTVAAMTLLLTFQMGTWVLTIIRG